MEKENKDLLFVEVNESDEVKRNILESLKEIVENLQRFEQFKESRKEKIDKINKLGRIVRGINTTVSDLKKSLPEAKIRAIKKISKTEEKKISKGKRHRKVIKKEIIKKEVVEKKPLTELQKLESELSTIEEKLESLK